MIPRLAPPQVALALVLASCGDVKPKSGPTSARSTDVKQAPNGNSTANERGPLSALESELDHPNLIPALRCVAFTWAEALLPKIGLNSSAYHNRHHSRANVNFGAASYIWDLICKTRMEDFEARRAGP